MPSTIDRLHSPCHIGRRIRQQELYELCDFAGLSFPLERKMVQLQFVPTDRSGLVKHRRVGDPTVE